MVSRSMVRHALVMLATVIAVWCLSGCGVVGARKTDAAKPAPVGSDEWKVQAGTAIEAVTRCWKTSRATGAGAEDVAVWAGSYDWATDAEPMSEVQKLELLRRNKEEVEALTIPTGLEEFYRLGRGLVRSYEKLGSDNARLLEIAATTQEGDPATTELIELQKERSALAQLIKENEPKMLEALKSFLATNNVSGAELLAAAGKSSQLESGDAAPVDTNSLEVQEPASQPDEPVVAEGSSQKGKPLFLIVGASSSSKSEMDAKLEEAIPLFGDMQGYFAVVKSDDFAGLTPGLWIVAEAYESKSNAQQNLDFAHRAFPDAYVKQAVPKTDAELQVYEQMVPQ